jgi:hypothetical protein
MIRDSAWFIGVSFSQEAACPLVIKYFMKRQGIIMYNSKHRPFLDESAIRIISFHHG